MKKKVPILLLTRDRPNLLEKVLTRLIRYTDWNEFDLWILDNYSTTANKKVINMFMANYPFINIYSTNFNQLSLIQNLVIQKLNSDVYIKIDDDILVSENWTKPLVDVYNRNYTNISFGSVVIPINGFGWVPFLQIMNLTENFKNNFPNTPLNQDCFDVAVFKDINVSEYIWNNCIDIDRTTSTFIKNQNGNYSDLICQHRYSIGAIIFSHKIWEQMGGFKVQENYDKVLKKQKRYNKLFDNIKNITNSKIRDERVRTIADLMAGALHSEVGEDEEGFFNFSKQNGLIIPVTTQGIVFHFSFGIADQSMMNKIYLKI